MPGRIEKTVFISYRRTNFFTALAVYQDLTQHGYDVFFDFQSIDSGDFEKVITENIKARAHFLIILSPSALERCNEPGDWLRREIEMAMDEKRNIIPLIMEGFDFGSPSTKAALTGKLATLSRYNGLRLIADYFFEAMVKLRSRYLNVALEDVLLHPLSAATKEINETQKISASEAFPVEPTQLTAEEWLEQGIKYESSDNLDEALRCYTEAIRLNPNLAIAHSFRGNIRAQKGDYEGAVEDCREAIRIDPSDADVYFFLGYVLREQGDIDGMITNFTEGTKLQPNDAAGWFERGLAYISKDDPESAIQDFNESIRLRPDYEEAFEARGDAYNMQGNFGMAIKDYSKAISLGSDNPEYYHSRANAYHDKGDLNNALADYDRVIQLQPEYAEAYFGRGSVLLEKGDVDRALHDFERTVYLKPDFHYAYLSRAILWEEKSDYSNAIADYRKYIELSGDESGDQKEIEDKIKGLRSKLTSKKKSSAKKRTK